MNKRLKALLRRARELEERLEGILEAAGEDGLSGAQREEYDELRAQLANVDETIRRERELEEQRTTTVDDPEAPVIEGEGRSEDNDDEETRSGRGRRVTGMRDREAERPFTNFGEQLRAIYQAEVSRGADVDRRLLHVNEVESRAATGMGETVPSDGGFAVQSDFRDEILRRVYDSGQLLSRTMRLPLGENSNGMTLVAVDEDSRATGSRLGGIRAYWVDEAEQITGSKTKLRKMEMKLKKLAALVYMTDELLGDAATLGQFVMQAAPEEIRFVVEDALLWGNGVGKPLGIFTSPAYVEVAKEAAQAADTVLAENIAKIWARAWARGRTNGVWVINQEVESQLPLLKIGDVPVYIPPGGIAGNPNFGTIFGRPVLVLEQAAALGDAKDISFVEPQEYVLIDKGGIQQATSMHVRFIYDETAFRFIYRVDGQPVWNKALTPYKGANTLSPFVGLAERT